MESKSCCFIGHRTIKDKEIIEKRLIGKITALIKEGVDTFYFGSRSRFDDLAWEVVSELRKEYQHIKRIYVRSSYAYIDDSYKNYLLESYEDTYMPEGVENAGAASYVERNQAMIDELFTSIRNAPPPDVCSVLLKNHELGEKLRILDNVKLSPQQLEKVEELFLTFKSC